MKPILAEGKTNERACTQEVLAGATVFYVENASTYFSAGNHIFVSTSGGTAVEYAGVAQTVTTTTVTVDEGVIGAKGSGAKIWKPTAYYQFYYTESGNEEGKDLGIDNVQSGGGTLWKSKLRDTTERVRLEWSIYPASAYDAMMTFIEDTLNDGLDDATLAWKDKYAGVRTARVKVVTNEWTRGVHSGSWLRKVALEAQVAGWNEYAT